MITPAAMPPDLNSVPSSPRNVMSTQDNATSSATRSMASPHSPTLNPGSNVTMSGVNPGPIRHPRPLTATELHLELEKEQEAVVNRLSRELQMLRQQSASVASTTSSTSTGPQESTDIPGHHVISAPAIPTSSRQHRSSSSLSSTSLAGLNAPTVSGITPARELSTAQPNSARGRSSRQNSVATRVQDASSVQMPVGSAEMRSSRSGSTSISSTARLEELAQQRAELEHVRRENEALRRRVQDLEKEVHRAGL